MKKKMKAKKPSVSRETDERQLLATVRTQWRKYCGQEKKFGKELAKTLICLHALYAKPGHGSFRKRLEELEICPATAYRLMLAHGWRRKPDKRANRAKQPVSMITRVADYLTEQFNREKWEQEFDAFVAELRRKVAAEFAEDCWQAITENKKPIPPVLAKAA